MKGDINNQTFLDAASQTSHLDTGGMVGVLDLSKEWTGGGGQFPRIFNRTVFVDQIKDGKLTPLRPAALRRDRRLRRQSQLVATPIVHVRRGRRQPAAAASPIPSAQDSPKERSPCRNSSRFALLGLGLGALYSLASQGLMVIYRGSGVLNFAHGAIGMVGRLRRVGGEGQARPAVVGRLDRRRR